MTLERKISSERCFKSGEYLASSFIAMVFQDLEAYE